MRIFFITGLSLAAVFGAACHAQAVDPADLFIIQGVKYESFDGTARLDIESNTPLNYVTYELEGPYRIIIDPLDTVWCDYSESVSFDDGIVKSVKFVKGRDVPGGPGKTYYPFDLVSIELRDTYSYHLLDTSSVITLNIGDASAIRAARRKRMSSRGTLLNDSGVTLDEAVIKVSHRPAGMGAGIPPDKDGVSVSGIGLKETAVIIDQLAKEREKIEIVREELSKEREKIELLRKNLNKDREMVETAWQEVEKRDVLFKKEDLKPDKESLPEKPEDMMPKDRETKMAEPKKKALVPRPVKEYKDEPVTEESLAKVLTLDECIQIAVSNSILVDVANQRVKLTKMKVNEAFRELFPEFTLIWDESKGKISDEYYKGRKVGGEFKQSVFHGGEYMYTWEQSKVNLKVAKENVNKVKEALIFDVTKAYYELAKALNKHDQQKKFIKDIGIDFNMADKEFKLDLMPKIDYMNIESLLDQAFHTILSYKNSASLAELELKKLMNVSMDSPIKISYELEFEEVDIDPDACVELAMQYKPEYRVSYLNTEVAKLTERIAKAATFPQFDIFGKYLRAAERLEPFPQALRRFLQKEYTWGATVSVPFGPHTFDYQKKRAKLQPTVTTFKSNTKYETDKMRLNLFDDMARGSNVADAALSYNEALDGLNKASQTVHTDIYESYFSFLEAKLKINNSLNNLELYKKELQIAQVKKGMNELTFYELIQAKAKLSAERSAYTDAIGDYHIAVSRMNRSIGLGGYFG